ncbi:hypothetical protein DIPPA_14635 [Diplonema papillatum]|nr:hypothetical protein DIPPA_14635 [Diplonema papillatum]
MDYIAELAMHEIALEGQGGVTLERLWGLLEDRVGDAIGDERARKALWARLCDLDGSQILLHRRQKDAWTRVEPQSLTWAEACSPDLVLKASVRYRILVLGMEMGNPRDAQVTLEIKKQAFQLLQFVGAARTEGVRQTTLSQKAGLDTFQCSLLLSYSENRNLISKVWSSFESDGTAKRRVVRMARIVLIKRLTERKIWPLFYSGLGFTQSVTNTMRKVQAMNILLKTLPVYLGKWIEQGSRIGVRQLLAEACAALLREYPGFDTDRTVRNVFFHVLENVLRRHQDWCITQAESGRFDVSPVADASEVMSCNVLASTDTDEPAEFTALHSKVRFSVSATPHFQQLLRSVVEASPRGVIRSSVCLHFDSKTAENLCKQVTEQANVSQFTCSLGKQQHVVYVTRARLAEAMLSLPAYLPSTDALFYPTTSADVRALSSPGLLARKRANADDFFSPAKRYRPDEHIPNWAAPAVDNTPEPVQKALHQPLALTTKTRFTARAAKDRGLYLSGTYRSWVPAVGSCSAPAPQWRPPPGGEAVALPAESETTTLNRASYWMQLHNARIKKDFVRELRSRRQKRDADEAAVKEEMVIEEEDEEQDTTLNLRPSGKSVTGDFFYARLMNHIAKHKVIGRLSLRSIIAETKQQSRHLKKLLDAGLITHHVVKFTVFDREQTYDLWAETGLDMNSDAAKKVKEEEENFLLLRSSTAAEARSRVLHISELTKNLKLPRDVKELKKQPNRKPGLFLEYLLRLEELPAKQVVDEAIGEKMTVDPLSRTTFFEAKRSTAAFWSMKNGFCPVRMMRLRLLHTYLVQLPGAFAQPFTLKDLLMGMRVRHYCQLVGFPADLKEYLGDAYQESVWETPIASAPAALVEYVTGKGANRIRKTTVTLTTAMELLLYLRLVVPVNTKMPVFGHDDGYRVNLLFANSFNLAKTATLQPLCAEVLRSLLPGQLDFDFSGSDDRDAKVNLYWETFRSVCTDVGVAPEDVNTSVLGASLRVTLSWDGIFPMSNMTERRHAEFVSTHKGPMKPSTAFRFQQISGTTYGSAAFFLVGNQAYAQANTRGVNVAIGSKRRRTTAIGREVRQAKKRKVTKKKEPKPRKREQAVDMERLELSDAEDASETIWATAENMVSLLEAVVLHGGESNLHRLHGSTMTNKGTFVLKSSHVPKIAAALGLPETRVKQRWRYLNMKPEMKSLSALARLLRKYNKDCGFPTNSGLRPFLAEAYTPGFSQGAEIPHTMKEFKEKCSVLTDIPDNRYQPYHIPTRLPPRTEAACEALKVVNLVPEQHYEADRAKELCTPFCELPDSSCLSTAVGYLTKATSMRPALLTRVKQPKSARHYQLSAAAELCLMPRALGLRYYQGLWAADNEMKEKEACRPHPVIDAGQVGHIAEEFSTGRMAVYPTGYAMQGNPFAHKRDGRGGHQITVSRLLHAFFPKQDAKATRRSPVFYMPKGIICVKSPPDPYSPLTAPPAKLVGATLTQGDPEATGEEERFDDSSEPLADYFHLWQTWENAEDALKEAVGCEKPAGAVGGGLEKLRAAARASDSAAEFEAAQSWAERNGAASEAFDWLESGTEFSTLRQAAAPLNADESMGHPGDDDDDDENDENDTDTDESDTDALPSSAGKKPANILSHELSFDDPAEAALAAAGPVSEVKPEAAEPPANSPDPDHPLKLICRVIPPTFTSGNPSFRMARAQAQSILNSPGTVALFLPSGVALEADLLASPQEGRSSGVECQLSSGEYSGFIAVVGAAMAVLLKSLTVAPYSCDGLTDADAARFVANALNAVVKDRQDLLWCVAEVAALLAFTAAGILRAAGLVTALPSGRDEVDVIYVNSTIGAHCKFPTQRMRVLEQRAKSRAELCTLRANPQGASHSVTAVTAAIALLAHVERRAQTEHTAVLSGVAAVLAVLASTAKPPVALREPACDRVEDRSKLGRQAKALVAGNTLPTEVTSAGYRRRFVSGGHGKGFEGTPRRITSLVGLDGRINHSILNRALVGVFDAVSAAPGVTFEALAVQFYFYTEPVLRDVLSHLSLGGFLHQTTCPASYAHAPASLMSSSGNAPRTHCYYPVAGCVKRLPRVMEEDDLFNVTA